MSLPDLDARAEIVVDLDAIAANVATLKAVSYTHLRAHET